jgi:hypothetical protein
MVALAGAGLPLTDIKDYVDLEENKHDQQTRGSAAWDQVRSCWSHHHRSYVG